MASTPNSMLPGQGLAGKHRNPGLVWLVWPIRHTLPGNAGWRRLWIPHLSPVSETNVQAKRGMSAPPEPASVGPRLARLERV
jgi:hypothetical protein